jgi:hypothetical protein
MEKIALTTLQACDALQKSIPAGEPVEAHLAQLIPELRQLLLRSCDAIHKAWELQGKKESCLCARCDFDSKEDWTLVLGGFEREADAVESKEETCRRDDPDCFWCGS